MPISSLHCRGMKKAPMSDFLKGFIIGSLVTWTAIITILVIVAIFSK